MEEKEIKEQINLLDAKRHPSETFQQYRLRLKVVNNILKYHKRNGYKNT